MIANESAATDMGNLGSKELANQQNQDDDGHGEADNQPMSRMVRDQTGRYTYIGDAATITFLHKICNIVEITIGQSPFTRDPKSGSIREAHIQRPSGAHLTYQLPPKQTALILVDAYFVQVRSLLRG